ncbi:MAG: hypothetical protein Q9181_002667 [Wetmoreana brouardii]
MDGGHGKTRSSRQNASPLPMTTHDEKLGVNKDSAGVPAAVYVAYVGAIENLFNGADLRYRSWMTLSCVVILFNKWILDRARYPILLTCYHLTFATIMTQILACTSSLLDGRHSVHMTAKLYMRAIVPIGLLYSLSLVCSNFPYLYLSVAFIQMLKGTASIAVFLALCSLGLTSPTLRVVLNLLVIVFGVILASLGEIKFHVIGFLYQMGGILFEAYRLAFIQKLLSDEKYKMDPLVSLYYFAPCCAAFICMMGVAGEWRDGVDWEELKSVGVGTWVGNGVMAMGLNVAGVLLIGKTSSLVLTLCGVLKNISLIAASMFIWGTVVTPIQFVGNGAVDLRNAPGVLGRLIEDGQGEGSDCGNFGNVLHRVFRDGGGVI